MALKKALPLPVASLKCHGRDKKNKIQRRQLTLRSYSYLLKFPKKSLRHPLNFNAASQNH